ncbi:protein of unknown function [Paraburkholderia dioscoreae]|uniref:Uncharacterized protein n=1 Tax=Paraburkholderia dioscoreae TaxID=2604047 RepID=A0A5Q4Z834_9BURK|nr:protein of unknown function [Paraburkholderia dioscoreae]
MDRTLLPSVVREVYNSFCANPLTAIYLRRVTDLSRLQHLFAIPAVIWDS